MSQPVSRLPERRRAPLAVLAGASLVPIVILGGMWQYADANVPPPTTTTTTTVPPPAAPELGTDLLSYRRHPTPLAERAAAEAAQAALAVQQTALVDLVGDGSCVRVVDEAGAVVAEKAPDVPVIPASNQKLIVAAAALEVLGPDHRFRTELRSVRPVDGVVTGPVYLVGGGDPVLVTADVADPQRYPAFNTTSLEPLADQLVALGVTTIDGDIVGDGSRYDDEFWLDEWGPEIIRIEAGPYDSLLVNDGLIGPSSPGNYGLDPARTAASAFLDLVRSRGITVTGAANDGPAPATDDLTTLAFIESLPLTDVLVEMLHTSDDNTAEMMLKELGFVASGAGTRQAGLDAVRATLERWGMPTGTLQLTDGSGLSRNNRAGCDLLVGVLTASPVADQLVNLLPAAGRDGTLADQLRGTEAEGAMVAKTGTLTDVKALSGSQPGANGRPVGFSLVLNQPDADEADVHLPVWEALVELIAAYPVEVEPDVHLFEPR
jgi:D-alanyl-D-alanine carboxypeptidase/D-alanyl-D-alanine-endopeptidase (penicillin-binding protein 4)